MDDELYQEFITESEESITQLNNALLELESNPDDDDAIDDIFRQAHTLKGNFGAMGFENASTVAHAVEDLLDAVRQDEIEVTPARMDLVFDGMDEILDILHDIEEHGESKRDPTDLVTEIRAAAESDGGEGGEVGAAADSDVNAADAAVADGPEGGSGDDRTGDDGTDDAGSGDGTGDEAVARARKRAVEVLDPEAPDVVDADTLVHARVSLDVGDMKGVDGGLFVSGLPDDLAVVGADPALDAIEEGAFGDDFVLFVADTPTAELDAILGGVWKVESTSVTEVTGFLEADTGAGDDVVPGTGTVPDGDVDPESASAAVDAVVSAYTGDGEPDDTPAEPDSAPTPETAVPDADPDGTDDGPGTGDDTSEADASGVGTEPSTHDGDDSDAAVDDTPADGDAAVDDTPADGDAAAGDSSAAGGGDSSGQSTSASEGDGSDSEDDGGESTPSISEVKSVRVDVDQLDELHSLVEQLVTSRIKLRQAVDGEASAGRDTLDELDKISSNLQDTVMDMRLIPLKKVFDKFPRLVRDLAREEDKRVDFSVEGENIELDRTILDEISDPLMHVLRNAVDHGIEPPEEREAAGKPRTGSVELRAEREHDTVVITAEDDGGGIDADVIREKAAEKGIRPREELDDLPDEEIYDYIFHPGFSTNEEITDVSGRGVGMDVVKTTVESLDGSVNVDSTLGEGTTVSIRLPVSVAIIKVLFVQADGREFGVPIKYIDEIANDTRVQRVDGAEVIVHDDRIFPLIRLREALGMGEAGHTGGMTVRIRPADRQIALRCDDVSRQEEVVVTPLQGPLKRTEGLSGTAVVGDGNVVPIIDINSLSVPDEGKQAQREWTPPEAEAEGAAD